MQCWFHPFKLLLLFCSVGERCLFWGARLLDVSGRPRASRDFSYPHQLAPAARARFMAACGQSVYYKATANGVDRGTVEFTGDGHAAGESSVEFAHRAHVVRLPHDEHPLSCTCGRPDCSGEPCKHVPPLFSILAKAGTLEVSTKYCLLGSCVVPSCSVADGLRLFASGERAGSVSPSLPLCNAAEIVR